LSRDFALTPHAPDHSISPESSDGFASVGTILPKEKVALLPGGLFVFAEAVLGGIWLSPFGSDSWASYGRLKGIEWMRGLSYDV
jgi:hypothetical protein